DRAGTNVALALGSEGELAVSDHNRIIVFDPSGRRAWSTFGVGGNGMVPSFVDRKRIYDRDGRISMTVDVRAGTWAPGAYWDVPCAGGQFLGDFAAGGKTFAVYAHVAPESPYGNLVVLRQEGYRLRPVFTLLHDAASKRFIARRDANGDGKFDDR